MTEQYKVGDKVLVEATVGSIDTNGHIWLASITDISRGICSIDPKEIRPYTPRQEFEHGEVVEVKDVNGKNWHKALYIGKSHVCDATYLHLANPLWHDGSLGSWSCYKHCRKLTTKKETITIGGVDYYKDDVEKALKDLKPVEGK